MILGAGRALSAPIATLQIPARIAHQLTFFSQHEYLLITAIAHQIVGESRRGDSPADTIDIALRADRYLANADPEVQEQFHLLLTVFNSPLFAFLFDFRFSSFLAMDPHSQGTFLEDWMTSRLAFRRTGFQALKRTCLSMFYTDSRSWDEISYHGMFLPAESR